MTAHIDLERLYRDVSPSVVSLYVSRDGPAMGSGTGFVVEGNHVLTNQHVVGDGRKSRRDLPANQNAAFW